MKFSFEVRMPGTFTSDEQAEIQQALEDVLVLTMSVQWNKHLERFSDEAPPTITGRRSPRYNESSWGVPDLLSVRKEDFVKYVEDGEVLGGTDLGGR